MSTKTVVLPLSIIALIGLAPVVSQAEVVGPACFSVAETSELYQVFVDILPGGALQGAGFEITSGIPVTVAGSISGDTARIGFTRYPDTSFHPRLTSFDLNINTLTGPGECEGVNGGDCGTGIAVTVAVVACP